MPTRHSDRWAGAHGVPLQAAENSGNVDLVNFLKKFWETWISPPPEMWNY